MFLLSDVFAENGLAFLAEGKLLGQPLALGWEPVTQYSISVLERPFYTVPQMALRVEH